MLEEPIISVEEGSKPETTDSEAGDSRIDRLLLRDLSCRVSRARSNNSVFAHLIEGDSFPKFINKLCHLPRIRALIYKPSRHAFCQQFMRSLFDPFQCTAKRVDQDRCDKRSVGIPGQLQTSVCLCLVSATHRYIRVLPEPIQVWDEIFDLFFDVFEFLRAFV
jgi:hypothetical protein